MPKTTRRKKAPKKAPEPLASLRPAREPHITRITSKDQVTPSYCILLAKVAKITSTIPPEPIIGGRQMEIVANRMLRWARAGKHDVNEIYEDACLMARTLLQYRWVEDFAQGVIQSGLMIEGRENSQSV